MEGFDEGQLICHHSRVVTDRGVFVCPILIEATDIPRIGCIPKVVETANVRFQDWRVRAATSRSSK